MKNVFIDTSAVYALLNRNDEFHQAAKEAFLKLDPSATAFICSSYVILETVTLLQNRIGIDSVREWRTAFEPILDIIWVNRDIHASAMAALTAAGQRHVSLTDWTSFEIMRQRGIDDAFTLDSHFAEQGFKCSPARDNWDEFLDLERFF